MTLEQAKALQRGMHVLSTRACYAKGTPCRVKINGMTKTWKREPARVSVPWKYGMYEFGYITEKTLGDFVLEEEAEIFFMDQYEDKSTEGFLEITPSQVTTRDWLILVHGKPHTEGYSNLDGCYVMRYPWSMVGIEADGYAHT